MCKEQDDYYVVRCPCKIHGLSVKVGQSSNPHRCRRPPPPTTTTTTTTTAAAAAAAACCCCCCLLLLRQLPPDDDYRYSYLSLHDCRRPNYHFYMLTFQQNIGISGHMRDQLLDLLVFFFFLLTCELS